MAQRHYTFTQDQLGTLLRGVIELRDEYVRVCGQELDDAVWNAVFDVMDGLDAEQELFAMGEKFIPYQVLP